MKVEKCINGETYVYTSIHKKDYIGLSNGGDLCKFYMSLEGKTYYNQGNFWNSETKVRLASVKEKKHFLDCHKAGEYIESKFTLLDYFINKHLGYGNRT